MRYEAILTYLTKNFGPETPHPVNVNKATPVEIESTLLLTRTESAAIVQYRTEKGDFKSVDDLKKRSRPRFQEDRSQKEPYHLLTSIPARGGCFPIRIWRSGCSQSAASELSNGAVLPAC